MVLKRLQEHGLAIKRSKCSFGATSVQYLGHVISDQGVAMDADKVEAVCAWSLPCTVRDVRGFLGLTGYYRKFIQSYGDIAAPLTKLLKRESFSWTPSATSAFEALKTALTTTSVLQLPDFSKPFIVDCDASGAGFGAVLHQDAGPLAFFSRVVAPHHAKLVAYERELIGLVKAVRHWRPYLWTRSFVVRTDHFSLKYLLDQRLSMISQHPWVSKLFGYQFTVEFKPGRQNSAADALSRRDEEGPLVNSLSIPTFDLFDQFRMEAENLPEVATKRQMIEAGTVGPGWSMVDGTVVHDGRLFMPASATAWPQILAHAHGTGHEGVQKTLQRLRQGTINWCESISKVVRSVSAIRPTIYIQQDCFSHYRFPAQYGLILQWILLKGSLKSAANQ
jgi:hypothetical protein